MIEEVQVTCPACWETVTLVVDLSAGSTSYTEDCEVCCRPMVVQVQVDASDNWAVDVYAENE